MWLTVPEPTAGAAPPAGAPARWRRVAVARAVGADGQAEWIFVTAGRAWSPPAAGERAPGASTAAAAAPGRERAPLGGRITEVHVAAGEQVAAGQVLVALEAMKMEHRLVAPAAARVVAVLARVGEVVATGAILVELTADP